MADPRLDPEHHAAAVIGAVLEEGDSRQIERLFERYGRARIERWLRHRGGRQLSRRSRALWRLVLDVEPGPPAAAAEALWPL